VLDAHEEKYNATSSNMKDLLLTYHSFKILYQNSADNKSIRFCGEMKMAKIKRRASGKVPVAIDVLSISSDRRLQIIRTSRDDRIRGGRSVTLLMRL
jgi:hypothetical protein